MLSKGMTVEDAAMRWVSEFNEVPPGVVNLLKAETEMTEITPPAAGDLIRLIERPEGYDGGAEEGEIVSRLPDGRYKVRMWDEQDVAIPEEDFYVIREYETPIWGTMWAFGDSLDNYWLSDPAHLQAMADCGFRVFEQEDYDYLFGIDGAGYDFWESHWCPLYRVRGLRWHDPDTEENNDR